MLLLSLDIVFRHVEFLFDPGVPDPNLFADTNPLFMDGMKGDRTDDGGVNTGPEF